MKRASLTILVIMLVVCDAAWFPIASARKNAQSSGGGTWCRIWGDSLQDEEGLGVWTDGAGSIYTAHSLEYTAIFLRKWDVTGNLVWEKEIMDENDYSSDFTYCGRADGGFYSAVWEPDDSQQYGMSLRRWDANGNLVWSTFRLNSTPRAICADDSDTHIYTALVEPWDELVLMQCNAAGNMTWNRTCYLPEGAWYPYTCSMGCGEDSVFVCFSHNSTTCLMRWDVNGTMLWNVTVADRDPRMWYDVTNGYIYVSSYAYLAKWTDLGVQVWNITDGGPATFTSIVRGDDRGGLYILDYRWLEKWTTNGTRVWSQEWGGENHPDWLNSLYTDSTGQLLTVGFTQSFAALNLFQTTPSSDAVLLKWNADTGETEHPADWRRYIPQGALPFITVGVLLLGFIVFVFICHNWSQKKLSTKEAGDPGEKVDPEPDLSHSDPVSL